MILPILSGNSNAQIVGGAELQQSFIGGSLIKKGWEVSCVTMDYGQRDGDRINGFRVHKSFGPNDGLIGLRFIYPRLFKTWDALKRADADVYYVRCASFLPGIVAIFCRTYKRKFVFAGAHDTDFIPGELRLPTIRDKVLYKYGLRRADGIVAQSEHQRSLLKMNYGLGAEVIPNFHPWKVRRLDLNERKYVLWVSRVKEWKRPELFISLADRFPKETFLMIGGRPEIGDRGFFEQMKKQANEKRNLRFLGFQPFEMTENYFDQCKVFINTSVWEGFPNTFLQAWRRGIPVISYVDPDNVVCKNGLGIVVDSEDGLRDALVEIISEPHGREARIYKYFEDNHSEKVGERYDQLFRTLIDKKSFI